MNSTRLQITPIHRIGTSIRGRLRLVLSIALLMGFCSLASPAAAATSDIQRDLERLLQAGPVLHAGKAWHGFTAQELNAILLQVYRERNFQPLWLSAEGPTERAKILCAFLSGAAEEGLPQEDYRVGEIGRLWKQRDDNNRARLDLLLTIGFARYVADAGEGRIDPSQVDQQAFADAREVRVDLPGAIRAGLRMQDLSNFLELQAPRILYYRQLKLALRQYRAIAQKGGWKPIPAGTNLRIGMSDPRIPLIRARLAMTGDLWWPDRSSTVFDNRLETAVKHFQMRHYLKQSGLLDAETLAAMNVSVDKRIRQIIINLERWRWLSRDLSGQQIFVNIAGFSLAGMRDGRVEMIMPVVVGETFHQTPIFNDRMEYIEINPNWTVPASIAANDYLPELQTNPTALLRKHIRIFDGPGKDAQELDLRSIDWHQVTPAQMGRYTLRQDPGSWNALGTAKFMFPNRYNVYLHDTSHPEFFGKHQRTLSHGCIRVSRPHELAAWVLGGEPAGWNLERVKSAVARGESATIRLDKPIPVYIIYRTAVVGEDNILRFRPDVYGHDALFERALFDSVLPG